jgi:hypothetical protein
MEMAEWLRRRPVKSLWRHVVVQFLLSTNIKIYIKTKIKLFFIKEGLNIYYLLYNIKKYNI